MDSMKILLSVTVALLIGALVLSWQGKNRGVANASNDELKRISMQLSELRKDNERLASMNRSQVAPPAPRPQAPPQVAEDPTEVERLKLQLAELEADKRKAERDAQVAEKEALTIAQRDVEKNDTELRRSRLISQAMLIAKVREYIDDPAAGGFVTLDVVDTANVQPGTVLAIRRNNGILGQLKISDVTAEGAIANPMPGFGVNKPQPGDELIIPPAY